jgi:hypothetical protein
LNSLRNEVFRNRLVMLAGIVFQACSFNHSDISPHARGAPARAARLAALAGGSRRRFSALESTSCGRSGIDYRKSLLQILLIFQVFQAIDIQRVTDSRKENVARIVSDLKYCPITYGDFPVSLTAIFPSKHRW